MGTQRDSQLQAAERLKHLQRGELQPGAALDVARPGGRVASKNLGAFRKADVKGKRGHPCEGAGVAGLKGGACWCEGRTSRILALWKVRFPGGFRAEK